MEPGEDCWRIVLRHCNPATVGLLHQWESDEHIPSCFRYRQRLRRWWLRGDDSLVELSLEPARTNGEHVYVPVPLAILGTCKHVIMRRYTPFVVTTLRALNRCVNTDVLQYQSNVTWQQPDFMLSMVVDTVSFMPLRGIYLSWGNLVPTSPKKGLAVPETHSARLLKGTIELGIQLPASM